MSFLSMHSPGHIVLSADDIDDKTIADDETWHVFDSRCNLQDIVATYFEQLLRMCLYTLTPEYILNVAKYSDRITLVMSKDTSPKLLGFSSMNAEVFDLPMEAAAWDGNTKMTFRELTGTKTVHRTNTKRDTPLVHISCIICDEPKERRKGQSLGQRLLEFEKILAFTMNFDSRLVALEAVKPLDQLFYAKQKFFTTTKSFYPLIYKDTVPMFHKLDISGMCLRLAACRNSSWYQTLLSLEKPKCIKTEQRVATKFERLWPVDDPREPIFEDATVIFTLINAFLWTKNLSDDQAMSRVRMFIRRAKFSEDQILRLWHMRRYTLGYCHTTSSFNEEFLSSYPDLVAKKEWFKPSSILFGDRDLYALRKLVSNLPSKDM